jgi:hypothetical protein
MEDAVRGATCVMAFHHGMLSKLRSCLSYTGRTLLMPQAVSLPPLSTLQGDPIPLSFSLSLPPLPFILPAQTQLSPTQAPKRFIPHSILPNHRLHPVPDIVGQRPSPSDAGRPGRSISGILPCVPPGSLVFLLPCGLREVKDPTYLIKAFR